MGLVKQHFYYTGILPICQAMFISESAEIFQNLRHSAPTPCAKRF
jgi:hypothetical protein